MSQQSDSEDASDLDEAVGPVSLVAALNERNSNSTENLPLWKVSDRVGNVDPCEGIGSMSNSERSIRLYRIWLTRALQHSDGPSLPLLCSRRVANYWIVSAMMRGLSDPVRGGTELDNTRCAVLVRTELLARGWYGDKDSLDGEKLAHRMRAVHLAVPCADIVLIAALIVELADESSAYTPEVTDISFGRIIASVDEEDLAALAARFASGPRSMRLHRPLQREGLSFLATEPPAPRRCLRERSDTCAAEHSEESLQRRLAYIFGNGPANGVWEKKTTRTETNKN